MGVFAQLVKTRGFGVPIPHHEAYEKLLATIREDESVSTIGRRAVLWLVTTSSLSSPVMSVFSHREWGGRLGREIQESADDIGSKCRDLFIACGTGLHLTHHCGGFDDSGRWTASFPGNTLWIAEGDENYPRPDGDRDNKNMMIITPSLREIGEISLRSES